MEAADINALVDVKVKEALKENNKELLNSIGTMVAQISSPINNTYTSDKEFKFKRKSNEEQYKQNARVLAKIEEAEAGINAQQFNTAKQSLIEAKDLVKRRQKLVQLADASELGWKVVAEYETNPIASESEDERRIFKAEARASRKDKASKAKKRPYRQAPYSRPGTKENQSSSYVPAYSNTHQRPGLCFHCGKSGHWKKECPQRDRSMNNKISVSFMNTVQSEISDLGKKRNDSSKEDQEDKINQKNKECTEESSEGIGLNASIKRRLDEAGIQNDDDDIMVKRMATQLLGSRADGTVNKYYYQVQAFKAFCENKGHSSYPAKSTHVAMYLSEMISKGKSVNVITSAFYGIKWLHSVNGLHDPTEDSFVKNMLESAKRLNSKPVVKKEVVSSEHLIELCDMFVGTSDVIVLRDLSMILLSYAGFLRFSEVSELKCNDITFYSDHLVLKIRKSKTDIYRSGKDVFISKGTSNACPYEMLKRYLSCSGLKDETEKFLFQPGCRSGSNCFLLDKGKKLSYTRARECIIQKLKLVAPGLHLGTHSLRASGATVAANAKGVSERCLKRHGRWRSDSAKDGYVEDSIEKKLYITKQLKL